MSSFKNREQEGKMGPECGFVSWEQGGYREGVQKGEYSRNVMYSFMKMEK
jgi:hypothetical protein